MRRGYESASWKLYKIKKPSSKFLRSEVSEFYNSTPKKNTNFKFFEKNSQKFLNSTILREMRRGYESASLKLYKIKKPSSKFLRSEISEFYNSTPKKHTL